VKPPYQKQSLRPYTALSLIYHSLSSVE